MWHMLQRYVQLVDWLNAPRKKQPYRPGIGLELSMIGLFILLGIAHLVVYLRG